MLMKENKRYLPLGLYIGQEKLLKQNAKSISLGRKCHNGEKKSLSKCEQEIQ